MPRGLHLGLRLIAHGLELRACLARLALRALGAARRVGLRLERREGLALERLDLDLRRRRRLARIAPDALELRTEQRGLGGGRGGGARLARGLDGLGRLRGGLRARRRRLGRRGLLLGRAHALPRRAQLLVRVLELRAPLGALVLRGAEVALRRLEGGAQLDELEARVARLRLLRRERLLLLLELLVQLLHAAQPLLRRGEPAPRLLQRDLARPQRDLLLGALLLFGGEGVVLVAALRRQRAQLPLRLGQLLLPHRQRAPRLLLRRPARRVRRGGLLLRLAQLRLQLRDLARGEAAARGLRGRAVLRRRRAQVGRLRLLPRDPLQPARLRRLGAGLVGGGARGDGVDLARAELHLEGGDLLDERVHLALPRVRHARRLLRAQPRVVQLRLLRLHADGEGHVGAARGGVGAAAEDAEGALPLGAQRRVLLLELVHLEAQLRQLRLHRRARVAGGRRRGRRRRRRAAHRAQPVGGAAIGGGVGGGGRQRDRRHAVPAQRRRRAARLLLLHGANRRAERDNVARYLLVVKGARRRGRRAHPRVERERRILRKMGPKENQAEMGGGDAVGRRPSMSR